MMGNSSYHTTLFLRHIRQFVTGKPIILGQLIVEFIGYLRLMQLLQFLQAALVPVKS